MFETLLKRLAYSKIVFVALIGLLACLCLVVPIITFGQNMLHREKSETAEKKESQDFISEENDTYNSEGETKADEMKKNVVGEEETSITELSIEDMLTEDKLTEDKLIEWDDMPRFEDSRTDTYGTEYENVVLFERYEYSYGHCSGIFCVKEGADTLNLIIAPDKSISSNPEKGLILEVYRIDRSGDQLEEELLYETPEIFRTSQVIEKEIDIKGASFVMLRLQNQNGTAGSPHIGALIVDGTFQ